MGLGSGVRRNLETKDSHQGAKGTKRTKVKNGYKVLKIKKDFAFPWCSWSLGGKLLF